MGTNIQCYSNISMSHQVLQDLWVHASPCTAAAVSVPAYVLIMECHAFPLSRWQLVCPFQPSAIKTLLFPILAKCKPVFTIFALCFNIPWYPIFLVPSFNTHFICPSSKLKSQCYYTLLVYHGIPLR